MASDQLLIQRAEVYWRGRYAPTCAGLRRIAGTVDHVAPFSSATLVDAAKRRTKHAANAFRHFPLFKDYKEGKPHYRQCIALSPTVAIAESAALDRIAGQQSMAPASCVYSYRWPSEASARPYEYFVDGYDKRTRDIQTRLRGDVRARVIEADIRNFYPSVSQDRIRALVRLAGLDSQTIDLVELMLSASPRGLPVGPALSHALANLVLRTFDQSMLKSFRGSYFRYVDDVVLVVNPEDEAAARQLLSDNLDRVGLDWHDEKGATVDGGLWLTHARPLNEPVQTAAGRVISLHALFESCRAFLAFGDSKRRAQLRAALQGAGLSFPLASMALPQKRSSLLRYLAGLFANEGASQRALVASVLTGGTPFLKRIVADAIALREHLKAELDKELERASLEKYEPLARRGAQRVRRLVNKLLYLLPREQYQTLLNRIPKVDDTAAQRAVVQTLVDGKLGRLLRYCGGPVRFAGILWRTHELPALPFGYALRSRVWLESAIELVLLGVLDPSLLIVGKLDADDVRMLQTILSRTSKRTKPDLSYQDELESLFLSSTRRHTAAEQYWLPTIADTSELMGEWGES